MRPSRLAGVLAVTALGLAGCGSPGDRIGAKAGICTPFATLAATTAGTPAIAPVAADAAAPLDDCLHRWAYTLAGSTDAADMVASATVAACLPVLSKWNQEPDAVAPNGPSGEPLSLVSGEPTNAMAAHREFAESRALFYVVQARAGHCDPPPPSKAPR